MDRSDTIPNRYENHHRPDNPFLLNSLAAGVLFPLGAAIFSIPFLICAYIIIGFVDQKLPDFNTYKAYWQGAIWLGGIAGVFAAAADYLGARSAVEDYERGYREWQAKKEQERLEFEQREAAEAERRRLWQMKLEREQAENDRRRRILQLEPLVLRAQAQHAVDTEFFGGSNPTALLAAFRRQLGQLSLADLGLLRESQDPLIREIVGDGSFLPPMPPLRLPSMSPT